VTGSFSGPGDLPGKVEKRLRETAAEDLAPWVKLGDVIVRATHVRASTSELRVQARVSDRGVLRALEELAGGGRGWGRRDLRVTYANRSGTGRIEDFSDESTSAAFSDVTLTAKVDWTGGGEMPVATQGYSAEDLTEVAMKVGLLGEPLPSELRQMSFLVKASDPLAELQALPVPEGAVQALSQLLTVEQLVGGRRASAVERFALGPVRNGQRHLELAWWEPRRYSNVELKLRRVAGVRPWA